MAHPIAHPTAGRGDVAGASGLPPQPYRYGAPVPQYGAPQYPQYPPQQQQYAQYPPQPQYAQYPGQAPPAY